MSRISDAEKMEEEGTNSTAITTPQQATPRRSPASSISQSTPALPTLRKQASVGRFPSIQTASAGTSPRTSRNTSPLRKDTKNVPTNAQTPSQPSAAAIQRALSASSVPQLANTASDVALRMPRPQRITATTGETSPHSVVSPRVKSPPPGTARRVSALQDGIPSINLQSSGEKAIQSPRQVSVDATNKSDQLQTPVKAATSRGPSGKSILATVDENSDTPAVVQTPADIRPLTKLGDDTDDRTSKAVESGSESGGNKSDGLTSRTTSQSQLAKRSKNSFTSLAKARPPETTRNMTVETETVQSIPHSGLSTGERNSSNRAEATGTVKMKSSNETIRPKKERRPPSKKARSVNQGVASSKADIFEARVASAVDEANSSDSDETFVYESNPPEPRRPRHHSRTPSVTSAHSTTDQGRGLRSFGEAIDERKVAGKRSMKFSNNPFHSSDSPSDRQDGTVRSHHARHYGRWGRGGSHASVFEPDSPFTQASKLRSNPHSIRHSRPNSPRSPQGQQRSGNPPLFGKRKGAPFDFDMEGGEDERTPLMSTIRTSRSSRNHLHSPDSDSASLDEYYNVRRRGRCGTMGSFILGLLIFALVVLSTIGFLVASNSPLSELRVYRIQNVLASEQEILLDLRVAAINPNALGISITDADISILAKSKYSAPDGTSDLEDEKSDDNDADTTPLLSLGHIYRFDQGLEFRGSPFRRSLHYSIGEVHLAHPGNKTGIDGSARWEKMLHHPFELILRGVLKYNLPVSAREESVEIGASVIVHPEDGVDTMGRMRLEPVDHSDHWQWIDWDRENDMLGNIAESENGAFE